ncbi:hypothetical protein SASPL_137723 [Salvia splendens]|uniref:Fe2OG dioxygenase domain-containing protein n=1 Tax=Salvia splendens TaxID=180675 RepID=A0A8X8WVH9_SALSN|nr:hypothetical protein SASPL_137723 [Salvia splendens]
MLSELLSEALRLPSDYLSNIQCMKSQSLACLYYPVSPQPHKTLGTPNHSDITFLTLLMQDTTVGLQILRHRQWLNVSPVRGALIANIGDLMQIISNGKFISVQHRVRVHAEVARVSVAAFVGPSVRASAKAFGPIKELLSLENTAAYREVLEMVNSRHDSPINQVASPSDVTIEEMFSSIMKEMHEVRDNVNAMQGEFTAFHEDINLLRDRVRHNHSIPPSVRERHGRSDYKSRYHDDGLVIGSRRERVSKFHGESHSRRMRDHGHHKVHEWLMGEETSSKARKSSNSRHYGCGTSGRGIPPKKVDLSHPSYHTKISSWLSSNFPLSNSLIQSECDNVNYVVKERVKHMVDFVADDDEEQS